MSDGVMNCCRSVCFWSWIYRVPVLEGDLALWTSVLTFRRFLARLLHTQPEIWNTIEEISR